MKIARFEYKCRLCGQTFPGPVTSPENARTILIAMATGTWDTLKQSMMGSSMLTPSMPHTCARNTTGLADLIGYSLEEEARLPLSATGTE